MQIQDLMDEKGMYNGKEIEVKSFTSFIEKQILCNQVIDGCLETNENNMVVCNFFMKKLLKDMKIIATYTDLEFGEDSIQEYDFMIQNEIWDYILDRIADSEKNFIDEMINCEVEQRMRVGNSVENILSQKLQQLIDKLPTDKQLKSLSKSLVKDINKLDWDKLPMLKDMWNVANGNQSEGEEIGR